MRCSRRIPVTPVTAAEMSEYVGVYSQRTATNPPRDSGWVCRIQVSLLSILGLLQTQPVCNHRHVAIAELRYAADAKYGVFSS